MQDTGQVQKQIDYYDNRWKQFSHANLFCLERSIFFLDALRRAGLDKPHICDLGCGAGWLSGILSNFGTVVGVELSPEAVRLASYRYPGVQFIAADATAWQPELHTFDVIVSQEVIEHIEDKAAYLRVAHQALKPGGYLLMTTPNLDVLEAITKQERETIWEIQPVELPLRRRELAALLDAAGFDVVATSSAVDQQGRTGIHRLVNSFKLRGGLKALGLLEFWKYTLLKLDFGMYLTTTARSR